MHRHALWLALCAAISVSAEAQTLDFETIPGQGTPVDGQLISTQFESVFGVSFQLLENDGAPADPTIGPRMAQVGGAKTAFVGPGMNPDCDAGGTTTNDTVRDLPRTGCWMLTDDGVHPGPRPFGLRIIYSTPAMQAGGELLDVDGGPEAWRITALDANLQPIVHPDNPIEIAYPSSPGTGDGEATVFLFSLGEPIHFIDLIYTGEASFGRGLAFDNFSASTLPVSIAGRVPNGADGLGLPLMVAKSGGGRIDMTWGSSCLPSDSDYEIYEGRIGGVFDDHEPILCSTAGATTSGPFVPDPGSSYYLVVPINGSAQGSYGTTSAGSERPGGVGDCGFPQVLGTPVCP